MGVPPRVTSRTLVRSAFTVESDEPIPTVSFSPTDVTVDEGGSVESVLIAEGALGAEVGMVTLSVKAGDAMSASMAGHGQAGGER